jgi:hypothetical protein
MVQQLSKRERQALHMNAADDNSMRVSLAIDRENQGGVGTHGQAVRRQIVVNRALDAMWKRHHDGGAP